MIYLKEVHNGQIIRNDTKIPYDKVLERFLFHS